jgi:hypothetical protein
VTVYVDDFRVSARVGRCTARWSHLFTDGGYAELHTFAAQIGLRRAWFQHKPPHSPGGVDRSHYDVTDGKRQQALAAGAVAVSWRDTPAILRAAQQRTPDDQPAPGGEHS